MTPRRGAKPSRSVGSAPGREARRSRGRGRARVSGAKGTPAQAPSALEARRSPRQERARTTVAAILEAAGQVIAEEGYAAMTTNRVAARAGVSIGSLYQYFSNKRALLVRLLEEHQARVHPVVERSLEELLDPGVCYAEGMRRLFERLLALHRHANPRLQRALGEEVPHPPHVREQHRRREAEYTARVAAILRARPDVEVDDPEMAARVLVQATSALTRWLAHDAPTGLDREAYVEEAVRLLTAAHQRSTRS